MNQQGKDFFNNLYIVLNNSQNNLINVTNINNRFSNYMFLSIITILPYLY